jgi:hypothetical protein
VCKDAARPDGNGFVVGDREVDAVEGTGMLVELPAQLRKDLLYDPWFNLDAFGRLKQTCRFLKREIEAHYVPLVPCNWRKLLTRLGRWYGHALVEAFVVHLVRPFMARLPPFVGLDAALYLSFSPPAHNAVLRHYEFFVGSLFQVTLVRDAHNRSVFRPHPPEWVDLDRDMPAFIARLEARFAQQRALAKVDKALRAAHAQASKDVKKLTKRLDAMIEDRGRFLQTRALTDMCDARIAEATKARDEAAARYAKLEIELEEGAARALEGGKGKKDKQ